MKRCDGSVRFGRLVLVMHDFNSESGTEEEPTLKCGLRKEKQGARCWLPVANKKPGS